MDSLCIADLLRFVPAPLPYPIREVACSASGRYTAISTHCGILVFKP